MNSPVVTAVGAALVACALSACGASGGGGASTGTDSTTSVTSTTSSDTPSASPDSSSATAGSATTSPRAGGATAPMGAMHACRPDDLVLTAGRSVGAMGHVGLTILFHNVSRTGCTLEGYPGVAGLDQQGHQAVQATRSANGYIGGAYAVRTIMVAPGGAASTMVEGTDVPSGTATSCATYPALLVTAPGHTDSHVVHVSFPGCSGIEVHPVVAGAAGRP